ncbi:MAG: TRAM domain-containing protein, partial [Eubacteriaceae bacterium]|nr:TRAM domain-containing protein [Eubacteriaceae bacterium]
MEKGNIVEVRIEDMSGEGQGIGKTADGFVVFVPGAVAGDVVRAELTKVKKNYGFARLLDVLEESPDRTDEFDCEFFENGCGGCQFGRLRYGAQLALKESQVRSRLERIACLQDPVIRPIIGMDDEDNDGSGPYRYRNKAQFPVSTGGIITRKGGIVENLGDPAVGFFRAKSHEVVDCGDCYLQSLPAMAAADALRRFMEEDHITAWDPKWEKGLIRHLIVKTGFYTGEVMVVIVINGNGIPNVQKLVEMLDDAIYDVGYSLESVVVNIKKGEAGAGGGAGAGAGGKKRGSRSGGGSKAARRPKAGAGPDIMGDKNVVVAGKPVIIDRVGGMEFEISPMSFYQVNPVQMKRLYDKVREYCGFDTDAGQAGNAAAAEVQADGIMDGA